MFELCAVLCCADYFDDALLGGVGVHRLVVVVVVVVFVVPWGDPGKWSWPVSVDSKIGLFGLGPISGLSGFYS